MLYCTVYPLKALVAKHERASEVPQLSRNRSGGKCVVNSPSVSVPLTVHFCPNEPTRHCSECQKEIEPKFGSDAVLAAPTVADDRWTK